MSPKPLAENMRTHLSLVLREPRTQREYLIFKKVDGKTSLEKLEKLKTEWRKFQKKRHRQSYEKKRRRLSITLSSQEKKILSEKASDYGVSLSTFCKNTLLKEAGREYVLPRQKELDTLRAEIRKVGNNVNQIARKVNASDTVGTSDVERIQRQLYAMENHIAEAFKNPETVHAHQILPPQGGQARHVGGL